jgi:DNA primase
MIKKSKIPQFTRELYHKSKVLYGIFQAKQAIAKLNNCYLVEGYTDVIQFKQSELKMLSLPQGQL